MMRAGLIALAAGAAPAAAQDPAQAIACAFTLVCAPEIECAPHEGIPFEIGHDAGIWSVEIDGIRVEGAPVPGDRPALSFAAGNDTLLFSLGADGQGALSRHGTGPGGRTTVASFLGRCVTA
jgi:hypothetical protein